MSCSLGVMEGVWAMRSFRASISSACCAADEVDLRSGVRPRRRSRARRAALVLHQLQGHAEGRLRRREDEVDVVGLDLALQDNASACQFGLGVFEVVDFDSEMADDRGLAVLELWHAETCSADLDQLQGRFAGQQNLQVDVVGDKTVANR